MAHFFQEIAIDLYEVAKRNCTIEEIYTDFQIFKKGVGGQIPFSQIMINESIAYEDKALLIQELNPFFKEETQKFFNAFVQEDHCDVIYQGIEYFEQLYNEHHVKITSAVALTKEQIQRLLTKITLKMNVTIDTYDTVVDETVIGGIKVESNTFLVDSTVKTQLQVFEQQI